MAPRRRNGKSGSERGPAEAQKPLVGPSTLAVHGGEPRPKPGHALATPSAASPVMPAIGPSLAGAGGVLAGAIVAWAVSRPVLNAFRRATVAMMAVMGTALVAGATLPAHQLAGRTGLAVVAALCIAGIVVAWRLLLASSD